MLKSKYGKIFVVIIGLLVLSGLVFCVLSSKNNNDISPIDVQEEQISDDAKTQKITEKEKFQKEEITNPAQKYYKDYLEQDEIKFLRNAKSSKDNDLEFSKLQTKFIKATDVLNEKYIENIDPEDAYYKNNWVKIPYVEGSYFYSVNSDYLLKKYGKYLSSAYRDWLKFILKREAVMQDGGLAVQPDKVREYIVFLEKFTQQNPEFVLISDAKDILDSYLMIYLEGIDNSPIFDKWNTRKMLPEFKASYEKFLSEDKDSKYYPMVEELYNKAKENNFTWDRNFDQWLYEYHKKYFVK
jgi:hypothetical protein